MIFNNKLFYFFCVIFCFVFLPSCSRSQLVSRRCFVMGTVVEVLCPSEAGATIVFDEFKRLDRLFDYFSDASEVSRLNKAGSIKASEELKVLIRESIEFSRDSNGAFDITCAPVVDIWKKAIRNKALPDEAEIKKALRLTGWDNISLDENSGRVAFKKKGMKIDLGAIAKGFALDCAVRKLKAKGINSALINAGGQIYCLGTNAGRPWKVGIQDARKKGDVIGSLYLDTKAVATSGDYEQFFEINGRRYCHIIDPRTGYPADSGLGSVTVVADNGITADVLATAIFVLGENKGLELAKRFKVSDVRMIKEVR